MYSNDASDLITAVAEKCSYKNNFKTKSPYSDQIHDFISRKMRVKNKFFPEDNHHKIKDKLTI
jgi:hypothetical protein